jgi:hypothetical protein
VGSLGALVAAVPEMKESRQASASVSTCSARVISSAVSVMTREIFSRFNGLTRFWWSEGVSNGIRDDEGRREAGPCCLRWEKQRSAQGGKRTFNIGTPSRSSCPVCRFGSDHKREFAILTRRPISKL